MVEERCHSSMTPKLVADEGRNQIQSEALTQAPTVTFTSCIYRIGVVCCTCV